MYALVDCNNFYVSCERLFNPSLNDKPVIVLSNNDGCIISRSDEAKNLGIKMAEPAFKIEPLLKKNNVTVYSSNYTLYGDISQRVMNTISEFVPAMEIYSIDESFLDLSGFQLLNIEEQCRKMRKAVLKNVGIPVSIGVSKTKTLAKIANKIAKKQKDKQGVFIMDDDQQINEILKITDVSDIWGIGYNYAYFLKGHNIRTANDFIKAERSWIKKHLSIVGVRIQDELSGISCIELELVRPAKKAICTSRSFGEMLTDKIIIKEAVTTYAIRCAYKLRKQKSAASVLMVFLETNRFKETEKQYYGKKVITLPVESNNNTELAKYAGIALDTIFREGLRYKRAGVIVSGIVPESQVQGDLFDKTDRKKQKQMMAVLDKINDTYGKDKIKIAAQGTGKKWKLRQEKLSPSYTTKWGDIIIVNSK